MRLSENYKKNVSNLNNPNYDHYAIGSHQTNVKMEPETKPKYRETVVPTDGIRWGTDPRRQSFISNGFLLPLSQPSGTGVSPWLVDPDQPLPIHFVPFQQWGQCWGHRCGHMVGAAPAPLPLCPERTPWACLGVTAHPGLSPSQGSNADLTGELLTPLQCNLYVLPTSM